MSAAGAAWGAAAAVTTSAVHLIVDHAHFVSSGHLTSSEINVLSIVGPIVSALGVAYIYSHNRSDEPDRPPRTSVRRRRVSALPSDPAELERLRDRIDAKLRDQP